MCHSNRAILAFIFQSTERHGLVNKMMLEEKAKLVVGTGMHIPIISRRAFQWLKKPSEELKGFAKSRLLKPGESETIRFTINPKNLCSFDTKSASWIAAGGNYAVKIDTSSTDIK